MYFQKFLYLLPVLASTISCGPMAATDKAPAARGPDEDYKLHIEWKRDSEGVVKRDGPAHRGPDEDYKLHIEWKRDNGVMEKRDAPANRGPDEDYKLHIEWKTKRDVATEIMERGFDVNTLPPSVTSKLNALGFDGTKGNWTVSYA
ncbi:MAG: hypothetical protein M1812_007296 [Candelaria pacifica]|nr:MAG: hypothetical protein M1812_007296 [Candelaria pacifica]